MEDDYSTPRQQQQLTEAELLDKRFLGRVIRPSDDQFEKEAIRSVNAQIRHVHEKPRLIIQARGVADVIECVKYAKEKGLSVSARSSSNSLHWTTDGLLIDLSLMRGVRVNPQKRTVRVEGGAIQKDVDRATAIHRLAVPAGILPRVGFAGTAFGGGIGWLSRSFGLTADHLVSVDLVTANGELLICDEKNHSDLFWALRGAGHNFGIITSFKLRAHPIDTVYVGMMAFPLERYKEVSKEYVALFSNPDTPRQLSVYLAFSTSLEARMKNILVLVCYNGPEKDGARYVKAFRDLKPIVTRLASMPFHVWQSSNEHMESPGCHVHQKASIVDSLPETLFETIYKSFTDVPSPHSLVIIEPFGGAMLDTPLEATAVAWRNHKFAVTTMSIWEKEADSSTNINWLNKTLELMTPFKVSVTYINYLVDSPLNEKLASPHELYGDFLPKLLKLKKEYDPNNLFFKELS